MKISMREDSSVDWADTVSVGKLKCLTRWGSDSWTALYWWACCSFAHTWGTRAAGDSGREGTTRANNHQTKASLILKDGPESAAFISYLDCLVLMKCETLMQPIWVEANH